MSDFTPVTSCPRCGIDFRGTGTYGYVRISETQSGAWGCLGCGLPIRPCRPIGNQPALGLDSFRAETALRLTALAKLHSEEGWGSRFRDEPVIACRVPGTPGYGPTELPKKDLLKEAGIAAEAAAEGEDWSW